jgi:hypothetical protein
MGSTLMRDPGVWPSVHRFRSAEIELEQNGTKSPRNRPSNDQAVFKMLIWSTRPSS